jgi:hypothetical protein
LRRALLALILLAAAAWVWWRYFPDTLPAVVGETVVRSPVANPPLYKWRDSKGQWQVTDKPPSDRPYETVIVDPNQNVVPSVVPGQTKPPEN